MTQKYLKKNLKKMELTDTSVVVCTPEVGDYLQDMPLDGLKHKVPILVVDNLSDIITLDLDGMANLGWYRKEPTWEGTEMRL